jgi:hypothetical protein
MPASLLWAAVAATAGIGFWLTAVLVTVLPARDPANLVAWASIAVGLLALAALTAAYLAVGHRRGPLRATAAAAGGVAVLFGSWMAIRMLAGPGEFEGYVVLIGLAVAIHGVMLVTDVLDSRVLRRDR